MQRLKRFLLPAMCALAAAAAVMFLTPHRGEAQYSSPVRLVRNDENPARQPFVASGQVDSLVGLNIGKLSPTVPLAVGQRLIIENVSAQCTGSPGTRFVAAVTATTGGVTTSHFVPTFFQGTFSGSDVSSAGQQVRLYADPGSTVYFAPARHNGSWRHLFCGDLRYARQRAVGA